ncbi:MAG: phosphoenolpyruvate carboxykinase (ATP) [Planctomycetota bacterium]
MPYQIRLDSYGIHNVKVLRNLSAAELYEHAVQYDDAQITANGALRVDSRDKKGRSPKDKRVVDESTSRDDVWWGDINIPLSTTAFQKNRSQAIEYFNTCDRVYVVDAFAGWSAKDRIKVRIICSRPYHALFMNNMLIRPTQQEANQFGDPDYVIFNAGQSPANPAIDGVETTTSVALNFALGEFVILGTEYAGEMKKGVFTIMNYLLPKKGVLSMHCSANEGKKGDVSLFFGLSGTGKTTLSADPNRDLIGDDEHGWGEDGVFNIEGGCYAKCIDLSAKSEPEIYGAIKFGTVLENTVLDPVTRIVDFHDSSLTENTRASYPIEFIPHAQIPCRGRHPRNIIFLTCDAFGVLPPVSLLTPEQAMYHFISGYTAKVAGTEVGVTEPKPNFSACFGAPFLVWHPTVYAELLAKKMREHDVKAYLVNTGWSGGAYGTGSRMSLGYTRAVINAIHDGTILESETVTDPVFGLQTPTVCSHVPTELLQPRNSWQDGTAYDETATKLAGLFAENFRKYADVASPEIAAAGPNVGN